MKYKVEQLKIDNDTDGVKAAKIFKYAVKHAMSWNTEHQNNLIDRPLEEYTGQGLFVINDNSCYKDQPGDSPLIIAGGAVLAGGFIASVFKDQSYACAEKYKGMLSSLMAAMIEYGGSRLVCKGELAKVYMPFGFVPVAHAVPGIVNGEYMPEKFYFYKPKENEVLPSKPEKFETYNEAFRHLKAFTPKKKTLSLII